MSCSCVCVTRCEKTDYRGKIKAVSFDKKTARVRFSCESVGHVLEDYIPLESVEEVTLSATVVGRLERLLRRHKWTTRPVVRAEQVVINRHAGGTWYSFTGEYEKWIAHRACSMGGHQANRTWEEIEKLIENADQVVGT